MNSDLPEGARAALLIPPAQLEQLRSEESFHILVTLARALNALMFAQLAPHELAGNAGPRGNRQVFNGMFYMAAILSEALSPTDAT